MKNIAAKEFWKISVFCRWWIRNQTDFWKCAKDDLGTGWTSDGIFCSLPVNPLALFLLAIELWISLKLGSKNPHCGCNLHHQCTVYWQSWSALGNSALCISLLLNAYINTWDTGFPAGTDHSLVHYTEFDCTLQANTHCESWALAQFYTSKTS